MCWRLVGGAVRDDESPPPRNLHYSCRRLRFEFSASRIASPNKCVCCSFVLLCFLFLLESSGSSRKKVSLSLVVVLLALCNRTCSVSVLQDVLRIVVRKEGFFSLWKGFTPYYARLGPHTVLTFIFLEQMNKFYRKYVLKDASSTSGGL